MFAKKFGSEARATWQAAGGGEPDSFTEFINSPKLATTKQENIMTEVSLWMRKPLNLRTAERVLTVSMLSEAQSRIGRMSWRRVEDSMAACWEPGSEGSNEFELSKAKGSKRHREQLQVEKQSLQIVELGAAAE